MLVVWDGPGRLVLGRCCVQSRTQKQAGMLQVCLGWEDSGTWLGAGTSKNENQVGPSGRWSY